LAKNRQKRILHAAVTTQNIVSIILLALIAILTLSFCIIILLRNAALRKENEAYKGQLDVLQEEGYYTTSQTDTLVEEAAEAASNKAKEEILDDIRTKLENGTSTNTMIRSLFPDQLVLAKSGRYYFIPIDEMLSMHSFSDEDFAKNDLGIMEYTGDDANVSGTLGIDVSKFQGDIDWMSVYDAGVRYAFIRVGNRGTSTGEIVLDEKFEDNINGALNAGIDVGVYFYSAAVSEDEALEEAQFVLDTIEGYNITLPIVIDIESPDSTDYRTMDLSKDEHTNIALKFCNTISTAGYTPMIYGNLESFTLLLDMTKLEGIDKWIAYYSTPQYFPYDFTYWQYTAKGSINGIDGSVDLNIFVK